MQIFERRITMFKTLITKTTVISALLFTSLLGVHNANAADSSFGYADAQEQARRLITGPIAGSNDGPAYTGTVLTVQTQDVDVHKQIERVLSAPLPL
jgi:hypothetical protein